MFALIGLVVVCSVASSTKAGRAAARKALSRHNWKFWTVAAVISIAIVTGH